MTAEDSEAILREVAWITNEGTRAWLDALKKPTLASNVSGTDDLAQNIVLTRYYMQIEHQKPYIDESFEGALD